MLINPQKFLDNGWVTSSDENPIDPSVQVQQAGLDVRVDNIMEIVGEGALFISTKQLPKYSSPRREGDIFFLERHKAYAVECMEKVHILLGYEGKLIHRSTLNRSGVLLTGSVYDPGYNGVIAGTMYTMNPIQIQRGARIGQLQIQTAEKGCLYDGDYQDQQSHEKAAESLNGGS